jgi:ribonuclease HII
MRGRPPTRSAERELREAGYDLVVGIDEVGRGAWAGPLVIGAAVVPVDRRVNGVRDSKMLPEKERERLFRRVADWCTAWAVGFVSEAECDEMGMTAAQREATRRALDRLGFTPDAAIVDGRWDFVSPHVPHVSCRVKADATSLSVAAASMLAKVCRDREMRRLAEHYPPWSFDTNKGYPCAVHRAALGAYGPSAIHRRTWVFMDNYVPWTGVPRVIRAMPDDQPTLFDALDEELAALERVTQMAVDGPRPV